jgi:cobalt-zinc-cadmium efflux system outer membrane protein
MCSGQRGMGRDETRAPCVRLRDLLSRELTVETAVQVALLNNKTLQATYEDLSVAQADLVQAGLLQNPVFRRHVAFPVAGRCAARASASR